jgi:hypothetical protein
MQLLPGALRRLVLAAVATLLDRVNDDDPGPEPDVHDASYHLAGNQDTGQHGRGRDVAEPDGCEHGEVKYKASVRVRGSLKLRTEIPPITSVAANSSRNTGSLVARAPTARSGGYVALMIERT